MREILIADDHPLFRDALKRALAQAVPEAVLFEADSVPALQGLVEAHADAELLLLDLHMPGASGFSTLAYLRGQHPGLPVVVVSAQEEPAVIRRAIAHGASGYIPKSASARRCAPRRWPRRHRARHSCWRGAAAARRRRREYAAPP